MSLFRVSLIAGLTLGAVSLALPGHASPTDDEAPEVAEVAATDDVDPGTTWLDECPDDVDGAVDEDEASTAYAAGWCNPNAFPICAYVDGDRCSSGSAPFMCWLNPAVCEPGVCYCWGGRWDCF